MKINISQKKYNVIESARYMIRERAINKARAKIALANKQPEDFSLEDLEAIVKGEEDELKQKLASMPLYALLAVLGFAIL